MSKALQRRPEAAPPAPRPVRTYALSPLRLYTFGLLVFAAGFSAGVVLHAATSQPAPVPAVPSRPLDHGTAQPQASVLQAPSPGELQAVAELRSHLEHQPQDVAARVELANALFDMGNYAEAATHYEQALQLQPDNPDVRTDLGIAYRNTGRPQLAAEAFRRAIRSDPGHRNAHYNLGVVLAQDLKDRAGAVTAWERYLQLAPGAPNSAEVRRSLAQLRQGR